MAERRLFNKQDIWLFIGLVALVLLTYIWRGFASNPDERFVQITVAGQTILTAPLDNIDPTTFILEEPSIQFLLTDGAAAFISSNCPDQICVHSGLKTQPGQMAICLPNRTFLLIIGTSDDIIDTFAY